MRKILIYITLLLFSGCTFSFSTLKYKQHSIEALDFFWIKDYDKSIEYFDTSEVPDSIMNKAISDFKLTLDNIRNSIVQDFGDTIKFRYINSTKILGNQSDDNISIVKIQITNRNYYGNIELEYNDINGLIKTIRFMDIKEEIPSLTQFWLLGIYPLILIVFQIWLIVRIVRSNLKRKWLNLILIFFLNFPTFNLPNIKKVNWESNFQLLLGVGFDYEGFGHYVWVLSIPIGSILVLLIYRKKLFKFNTSKP